VSRPFIAHPECGIAARNQHLRKKSRDKCRDMRLDNGRIDWIELDLPNVIAFRQKPGEPTNPRHILLAASIFDQNSRIPQVKRRSRSRVLFVAECLFHISRKSGTGKYSGGWLTQERKCSLRQVRR
jgi:hypothetical protein